MAYDSQSDRIILFGGIAQAGYDDETWAYDFNTNTWTNMSPTTKPPARSLHAMAYDVRFDRVVLFGGRDAHRAYNDTWAYDFETNAWKNLTRTPGLIKFQVPAARAAFGMANDVLNSRVILFGGFSLDRGVLADTWSYDFGTNTWTNMSPTTGPSARSFHSMAFDYPFDMVVLFGGSDSSNADLDDTWTYYFPMNTWTKKNPATSPAPRYGHATAYDSESDRVVLFGGLRVGGPFFGDTWAYRLPSDTWAEMNPATSPAPRYGHATAYDSESDRVVLFGGSSRDAETWAYDFNANAWAYMGPLPPSAPRSLQVVAGDAVLTLTWQTPLYDGGSAITNYRVYRGAVSGSLSSVATIGNLLTYSDPGLTNGQTYYYTVSAINGIGEGPRSLEVSATPSLTADMTEPTIVIASPASGATVAPGTVAVTGTAADDVAVAKVEVSAGGMTWIQATGATSWSGELTLSEGSSTIYARATDTSGNTATASVVVTVTRAGTEGLPAVPVIAVAVTGAAIVGVIAFVLFRRTKKRREGH